MLATRTRQAHPRDDGRRRRARRALVATCLAASALLGACRAGDAPPPPCAVAGVSIAPPAATLRVGETLPIAATPTAQRCTAGDLVVSWSSTAPAVASVTTSGLVTAIAPGVATVRAEVRGVSATMEVTVLAPVASVSVTPPAATLLAGETLQLAATARDAQGGTLAGRAIAWSSSDVAIASVSPGGLVTAVAAGGPVMISATSEGRSGTASITVAPPPRILLSTTAVAFTATQGGANPAAQGVVITNAGGGTLGGLAAGPVAYSGGAVGWLQLSLPAPSAAPTTTLFLQPLVATLGAGQYSATVPVTSPVATNSPQQVTVTLVVRPPPVGSVTVTPATFLLALGAKQAMTATLRDPAGAIVTGRAVQWSSSNPAVAAVDPVTGLVTAASVGVASIVATVDGVSGNAFAYTGTASAFDGTWRGSAGSGRTFAMTVALGRVTTVTIGVGSPPGSPCALSYTAAPLTLISGNAFAFSTSGGSASGSVGGTFLSASSAQGTYGTITFSDYLCPPNLLVSGSVPGGNWSAAKQ